MDTYKVSNVFHRFERQVGIGLIPSVLSESPELQSQLAKQGSAEIERKGDIVLQFLLLRCLSKF